MSNANPVQHHQQGAMPLAEFATLHGLTTGQAQYLANRGRILGAVRQRNGCWAVFPPAILLEGVRQYAKRQHVVNEVLPDVRRPRTLSDVQGAAPLTVDGVLPSGDSPAAHRPQRSEDGAQAGQVPPVFSCREVKEASRAVRLAASQGFYPVVLSGAQMLAVERAMLHEAEAVKAKLDFVDEFEPEARSATGEQLGTIYAALRVLKQAATVKNREGAGQQNVGVMP